MRLAPVGSLILKAPLSVRRPRLLQWRPPVVPCPIQLLHFRAVSLSRLRSKALACSRRLSSSLILTCRIQSGRDDPCRCRRKTEESDQADRESVARVAPREQPEAERDQAEACENYHCGARPPHCSDRIPSAAAPPAGPWVALAVVGGCDRPGAWCCIEPSLIPRTCCWGGPYHRRKLAPQRPNPLLHESR